MSLRSSLPGTAAKPSFFDLKVDSVIDLLSFNKIATSYFIEPLFNNSASSLTPRCQLFINSAFENHFSAKSPIFLTNHLPTSKASGSARRVEDSQITRSRPIIQLGTWVYGLLSLEAELKRSIPIA